MNKLVFISANMIMVKQCCIQLYIANSMTDTTNTTNTTSIVSAAATTTTTTSISKV